MKKQIIIIFGLVKNKWSNLEISIKYFIFVSINNLIQKKMKKTIKFIQFTIFALLVVFASCKKDENNNSSNNTPTPITDYAIAAINWGDFVITLVEPGVVTNVWTFDTTGGSGNATINGTNSFPYTYTKDAVNKSTLTFDVGGQDKYVMTWTKDTAGTFVESYNNIPGSNGTFRITR